MLKGADRASENFFNRGIERWEGEGRLSPSEAAQLRSQISSGDAQNAVHHMGVHLVLSVAIAFPIPSLRSLARFSWTAAFWVKAEATRMRSRVSKTVEKVPNIHSPNRLGSGDWGCFLSSFAPTAQKVHSTSVAGPGCQQDALQALYPHALEPGAGSGSSLGPGLATKSTCSPLVCWSGLSFIRAQRQHHDSDFSG